MHKSQAAHEQEVMLRRMNELIYTYLYGGQEELGGFMAPGKEHDTEAQSAHAAAGGTHDHKD